MRGDDGAIEYRIWSPVSLREEIESRWGRPAEGTSWSRKHFVVWLDEAAGWRALLGPLSDGEIVIRRYVPAAKLLRALLSWAPRGRVSERRWDAPARLGAHTTHGIWHLPPSEWDEDPIPVLTGWLGPRHDLIFYSVTISYGTASFKSGLLALMKSLWGAPRGLVRGGRKQLLFPTAPPIAVDDLGNQLDIEVLVLRRLVYEGALDH